jgi:hypothetical protein
VATEHSSQPARDFLKFLKFSLLHSYTEAEDWKGRGDSVLLLHQIQTSLTSEPEIKDYQNTGIQYQLGADSQLVLGLPEIFRKRLSLSINSNQKTILFEKLNP